MLLPDLSVGNDWVPMDDAIQKMKIDCQKLKGDIFFLFVERWTSKRPKNKKEYQDRGIKKGKNEQKCDHGINGLGRLTRHAPRLGFSVNIQYI